MSETICAQRLRAAAFSARIERSIVATGCTALMPDMAENRFNDMWQDPESIMHRGRNQPPKIVQRPVCDGVGASGSARFGDTPVEIVFEPAQSLKPSCRDQRQIAGRAVRPRQPRTCAQNVERAIAEIDFVLAPVFGALRR